MSICLYTLNTSPAVRSWRWWRGAPWRPSPGWGEVWTATPPTAGTYWTLNTNKELDFWIFSKSGFTDKAPVYLHGGSKSFCISSDESWSSWCDGQYHINHRHLLQRFLQEVINTFELQIFPSIMFAMFRWTNGLLFHQAVVDLARSAILIPLGKLCKGKCQT